MVWFGASRLVVWRNDTVAERCRVRLPESNGEKDERNQKSKIVPTSTIAKSRIFPTKINETTDVTPKLSNTLAPPPDLLIDIGLGPTHDRHGLGSSAVHLARAHPAAALPVDLIAEHRLVPVV